MGVPISQVEDYNQGMRRKLRGRQTVVWGGRFDESTVAQAAAAAGFECLHLAEDIARLEFACLEASDPILIREKIRKLREQFAGWRRELALIQWALWRFARNRTRRIVFLVFEEFFFTHGEARPPAALPVVGAGLRGFGHGGCVPSLL